MSAALARYDAACRAVAEARSVDEVKDIKDKAEALRAYARQANNPQLEADAWEIRKRAEDKLGELSAALDRSKGGHNPKATLPVDGKSKAQALKAAGISTSAANRYEQFNRLPTREKERRITLGRAAIEAGKSIADTIIKQDAKKERRIARKQALGAKQAARGNSERLPKPRDDIGLDSRGEVERIRARNDELENENARLRRENLLLKREVDALKQRLREVAA